jgi:hypothetical protein
MENYKIDGKILSLLDEINALVGEMGEYAAISSVVQNLKQIQQQIQHPQASIAFFYLSKPNQEFQIEVSRWMDIEGNPIQELFNGTEEKTLTKDFQGETFSISFSPFEKINSSTVAGHKPTLLIALLNQEDLLDSSWEEKILSYLSDKGIFFLISEAGISIPRESLRSFSKNVLYLENHSSDELAKKTKFSEKFGTKAFHGLLQAGINHNLLLSMENIFNLLDLVIEQEDRNLKGKKVLNQQQVIKVQSKANVSTYDIGADIKNLIQNQTALLEKGILDDLENQVRPQVGKFSQVSEQLTQEIVELETTKASRKNQLKIPKEVEEKAMYAVEKHFTELANRHLVSIRDSLKSLERDFEKLCLKNEIPSFSLNPKFLTDQQLKTILAGALRLERPYQSEAPVKGFYEYFMAMRKYQMIFFMLVSSFGLSFMRNLRSYMIPVTILLFGFGAYNVHKTVEKESEENEEKELGKARESLRQELKRMGAEISRQWGKVISDFLKTQNQQFLVLIESTLKEYFQKKGTEEEEMKKKIQRQVQSIDNSERKMSNIIRGKENLYRNILRSKSEVRQMLSQSLRS